MTLLGCLVGLGMLGRGTGCVALALLGLAATAVAILIACGIVWLAR